MRLIIFVLSRCTSFYSLSIPPFFQPYTSRPRHIFTLSFFSFYPTSKKGLTHPKRGNNVNKSTNQGDEIIFISFFCRERLPSQQVTCAYTFKKRLEPTPSRDNTSYTSSPFLKNSFKPKISRRTSTRININLISGDT
jgi:hypothetical protein